MGQSLAQIAYNNLLYSPSSDPRLWDNALYEKGWVSPQRDDVFAPETINRVFQQNILPTMSWQDLLKSSFQETGGQMGTPDLPVYDNLVKRLESTGWSDEQKKQSILNAANTHFAQHGSSYTGWSPEEGIAGLLGLPDYSSAAHQAAQQQYSQAHSDYSAQADADSFANALKLGSVLAAPFVVGGLTSAGVIPAGTVEGFGAGAAGTSLAEEVAMLTGSGVASPGVGGFSPSLGSFSVSGQIPGGSSRMAELWQAAQNTGQGAGMDWWTELGLTPADVGMEVSPWTTNPSIADLTGGVLTDAGSFAGSGILDTLKNIPTSVLKSAGILKDDGSMNAGSLANLLGKLGAGGLQYLSSKDMEKALTDLAVRYEGYGAPSRARFEASMTPGFDPNSIPGYAGALDTASKGILARLSAEGGNPFGNPGGLIDANKQIVAGTALPAIQNYQALNANTGFGPSMSGSIGLQQQAINQGGNALAGIGSALGSITAPDNSLAALIRQMQELELAGGKYFA